MLIKPNIKAFSRIYAIIGLCIVIPLAIFIQFSNLPRIFKQIFSGLRTVYLIVLLILLAVSNKTSR